MARAALETHCEAECYRCVHCGVLDLDRARRIAFPASGAFKLGNLHGSWPTRAHRTDSGGVLARLPLAFGARALLEAVADQLAIERRGVDAEDFAGPLLLPADALQHLEDVLLLQLLERQRRRVDHQRPALLEDAADLLRQILGLYHA